MKKTARLLNIIATRIDLELFYSVTYTKGEIRLQGHCKEQTLKLLRDSFGYEPSLKGNFIEMKKGCVNFTLTL